MKKVRVAFLSTGLLFLTAGHIAANNVEVTTTVAQSGLTLSVDKTGLTFSAKPGETSAAQSLATTVTGTGAYNLTFTGANLTGTTNPANTLAASTVQFYQNSTTWTQASASAQTVLNSTASSGGDSKTFQLRQVVPANAAADTYTGTVTIAAVAQ